MIDIKELENALNNRLSISNIEIDKRILCAGFSINQEDLNKDIESFLDLYNPRIDELISKCKSLYDKDFISNLIGDCYYISKPSICINGLQVIVTVEFGIFRHD